MNQLFTGLTLLILLSACPLPAASAAPASTGIAASAASAAKPAPEPAEDPPVPLPADVRQTESLMPDGAGLINIFPVNPYGKIKPPMQALLFVPRYYHPGRTWPLLVEAAEPGDLGRAARGFVEQAENRGFLFLALECSFIRKDVPGAKILSKEKVWNRQGGGTVVDLSRPPGEFARDLTVDSLAAVDLVRQVETRYNVARPGVAITGFVGTALLAYLQAAEHPETFRAIIARTGQFDPGYLNLGFGRKIDTSICIIYGANEIFKFSDQSKAAADFFRAHNYKHVTIEEIPNSGVDYRPEIAVNYFLGEFSGRAGPNRAAFDRATSRAGLCLVGEADPESAAAKDQPPTPISPAKALAALDNFVEAHPEDREFLPYCRFLAARLLHEKIHDDALAAARLREFSKPPLLGDAVAPDALLYLVDKVLGPKADRQDALALLHQAVDRYSLRPETAARAKELIKLLEGDKKQ